MRVDEVELVSVGKKDVRGIEKGTYLRRLRSPQREHIDKRTNGQECKKEKTIYVVGVLEVFGDRRGRLFLAGREKRKTFDRDRERGTNGSNSEKGVGPKDYFKPPRAKVEILRTFVTYGLRLFRTTAHC